MYSEYERQDAQMAIMLHYGWDFAKSTANLSSEPIQNRTRSWPLECYFYNYFPFFNYKKIKTQTYFKSILTAPNSSLQFKPATNKLS